MADKAAAEGEEGRLDLGAGRQRGKSSGLEILASFRGNLLTFRLFFI